MEDCIFCAIYKQKKEIVWEGKFLYIKYDNYPVSPGHAILIPKKHVVSIFDLSASEWNEIKKGIEAIITINNSTDFKAIYKKFIKNKLSERSILFSKRALEHPFINKEPDGYNFGVNEGKAAGRTVDHFHWHVIPRYQGDMEDPCGGVRYSIPKHGNYHNNPEQ